MNSQRLGARLIELNARSDLFAFHVSFKLMEIESERFRIGNKQCSRVAGATPNRLFPVQRVVHLPVAALLHRAPAAEVAAVLGGLRFPRRVADEAAALVARIASAAAEKPS